jgi:hypothetical protein
MKLSLSESGLKIHFRVNILPTAEIT